MSRCAFRAIGAGPLTSHTPPGVTQTARRPFSNDLSQSVTLLARRRRRASSSAAVPADPYGRLDGQYISRLRHPSSSTKVREGARKRAKAARRRRESAVHTILYIYWPSIHHRDLPHVPCSFLCTPSAKVRIKKQQKKRRKTGSWRGCCGVCGWSLISSTLSALRSPRRRCPVTPLIP